MSCAGGGFFGCKPNAAKNKKFSTAPILDAGKLRDQIVIETPALVEQDGAGGGMLGWNVVARVWADIETYNAGWHRNRTYFEQGQLREHRSWTITIPFIDKEITTAMRVIYKNHILQIDAVVNVDVYDVAIELNCVETGIKNAYNL